MVIVEMCFNLIKWSYDIIYDYLCIWFLMNTFYPFYIVNEIIV